MGTWNSLQIAQFASSRFPQARALRRGGGHCYHRALAKVGDGIGGDMQHELAVGAETLWGEVSGRLKDALNETS